MPKPKAGKKPTTPNWKEGDDVQFELDGDTLTGKVTKVAEDGVEVKVGKTVYECTNDEITKAEESAEEEETPEPEPDEPDADEPKKGKGKGKSIATTFNAIPRSEGGGPGLPKGQWEVLITGGDVSETDKGINLYLELTGVNDPDVEGVVGRKYYNLTDDAGNWQEMGVGILKNDLVNLGVDEDSISIEEDSAVDDLKSIVKKLVKKSPWATVKVVDAKKAGYTNTYINGLMENQDEKPENPNAGD